MADLRQGIIEAANALGMPPRQLATIISFESGFNPNVWGGKNGRHYGLIQFGPAERATYGVRVGDPSSQLGANGAIVKYYRANGWRPGMSMLDAYSIVNAGGPGRYNASDTAAGGTQGDVYDKVTNQFGPHWQRANQFLSGKLSGGGGDTGDTGDMVGPAVPLRHMGGADSSNKSFASNPGGNRIKHVGGAGSDPGYFAPINALGPDYGPSGGDPAMFPMPPEDASLADMFAKTVGGGGGGGGGIDLSQTGGVVGDDTGGALPTLDFASAVPPAGPPPPAVDLSPLAQLFQLKNIGQAPAIQQMAPFKSF